MLKVIKNELDREQYLPRATDVIQTDLQANSVEINMFIKDDVQ